MYTYKLDDLIVLFDSAKELEVKYIGVAVDTEGLEKPEVIITPIENFDKKLEFYKKTYDNDLNHKFSKDKIRIIEFVYGDDFAEIEKLLNEMTALDYDLEEEVLYIKCRRNGFMPDKDGDKQFCVNGYYYKIVNYDEDRSEVCIIDEIGEEHTFGRPFTSHYFNEHSITPNPFGTKTKYNK